MNDWLSWLLLPSSSRFLPSCSFNKRSGVFTLAFYPDKDSCVRKVKFFYDGGDILPDISDFFDFSEKDIDFIKVIISFFSFNVSSLRKAIHFKSKRKLVLNPKVALINSKFFGIKQVRARTHSSSFSITEKAKFISDLSKSSAFLSSLVEASARSYDFSFFFQWFDSLKLALASSDLPIATSIFRSISKKDGLAFDVFSDLVLDFQKSLC